MTGSNKKMKGFTLFYALLVASLALAIGASIFDITIREIDLSNAATQSQYAVYVSDSGAECALYWDNKYANLATNNNGDSHSAFATSSIDTQIPLSGIICSGADVAAPAVTAGTWPVQVAPNGPPNANAATTTFTFMGPPIPGKNQTPCAIIYVSKVGNPPVTTVTSHGYNTCVQGPLQLERVFQVTY
jgi:hypothetical protein